MDDFILRALLAGLLVVLVSGPLGCVVIWRRMAYFGDTLAHSALLGTAMGLLFELDPMIGVLVLGILISVLLVLFQRKPDLSTDTLLGIMAHGALAMGLVLLALMQNQGMRVDLLGYLFGDILAVSWSDLSWMLAGILLVAFCLRLLWRSMLSIAIHEELARSEGIAVDWIRLGFMLLMALVVAIAMKVVGILLITALLIVPAAAARRFAQSPESMAAVAIGFGVLSVILGMAASIHWDSPTGPSIVVASVLLFFASRLKAARFS
ncbi:MAG: metal ABC transporter permease [Gammaproteobacteria bacterium]|nr:metal ABC transporter permease [Gammaproteobacteria bacterium]